MDGPEYPLYYILTYLFCQSLENSIIQKLAISVFSFDSLDRYKYSRSGGEVDKASSSDALGSDLEPRSVCKYGFSSPMPSGSLELGAPLNS